MKTEHHLTVGDQPFCAWLGCAAGQDIAGKANVHTCAFESGAAAKRAAVRLRPFFCVPVRAAPGPCPTFSQG